MEVYIELAILDNFVIDGIITLLTLLALRCEIKFYKVLLSAVIGTVFAVITPLFIIPTWVIMILKFFVSILMCLVATPKSTLKESILFYLVFLTITFVMGGFCFFIVYLLGGDAEHLPIPVSLIVLFVFVYAMLLIKCIRAFYHKRKLHNHIYDIEVIYNGKTAKTRAYLDTGNTLTDGGLPVVIVSPKVFNSVSSVSLQSILLYHDIDKLRNARYIKYSTVGTENKLLVFEPDDFIIKTKSNTHVHVLIGVSMKPLSREFGALIGNIVKESL